MARWLLRGPHLGDRAGLENIARPVDCLDRALLKGAREARCATRGPSAAAVGGSNSGCHSARKLLSESTTKHGHRPQAGSKEVGSRI
jgi:hypothetical protein